MTTFLAFAGLSLTVWLTLPRLARFARLAASAGFRIEDRKDLNIWQGHALTVGGRELPANITVILHCEIMGNISRRRSVVGFHNRAIAAQGGPIVPSPSRGACSFRGMLVCLANVKVPGRLLPPAG